MKTELESMRGQLSDEHQSLASDINKLSDNSKGKYCHYLFIKKNSYQIKLTLPNGPHILVVLKYEKQYVYQGFHQVCYQGIVKATVFYRLQGLKSKISEGSDQN